MAEPLTAPCSKCGESYYFSSYALHSFLNLPERLQIVKTVSPGVHEFIATTDYVLIQGDYFLKLGQDGKRALYRVTNTGVRVNGGGYPSHVKEGTMRDVLLHKDPVKVGVIRLLLAADSQLTRSEVLSIKQLEKILTDPYTPSR